MLIRGYSEVSISRSGMRHDHEGSPYWGACFKLDGDVARLFPYLKGSLPSASYHLRPLSVRFQRQGVRCTLYPSDAVAAPFTDRDHAFDFIEALVVFLNEMWEQRDHLRPSYQVQRQPASIVEIIQALPQTNCGRCGHPTCMAYAAALRRSQAVPADCPEFVTPLSVSSVYPVFGPDGTVASTFAIDQAPPSAPQAATGPTAAPSPDRRDPHGLPIQQDLTPREIEVLRQVAEGASNREISDHLGISPHTVKSHVIHIFNKLSVNDRTQAAVWAAKNGIV